MLRWFHALMPKEERFFDMFAQHSRAIVGGAEALRAMLEGGDAIKRNYQIVMDREHDADDVTREVLIAVRRTFITPFDRGNIRDLITSMDNSIDQMQKTSGAVELYSISTFDPEMQGMADLIVEAATLTAEAMPLLRNISANTARLHQLTTRLVTLEGEADKLNYTGLKKLYEANGKSDPTRFIIGSELYRHLEKVCDKLEDVANQIDGLVIDHA